MFGLLHISWIKFWDTLYKRFCILPITIIFLPVFDTYLLFLQECKKCQISFNNKIINIHVSKLSFQYVFIIVRMFLQNSELSNTTAPKIIKVFYLTGNLWSVKYFIQVLNDQMIKVFHFFSLLPITTHQKRNKNKHRVSVPTPLLVQKTFTCYCCGSETTLNCRSTCITCTQILHILMRAEDRP